MAGQYWLPRCLIAGIVIGSMAAPSMAARAGAPHGRAYDDAYGDLGYSSTYDSGGYYDPSANFTYDPGGTCYYVTCDGGFSDPTVNLMYDATEEQEAVAEDSADAFDAYIQESQPLSGRASAVAGPEAFVALGRILTILTSATAAVRPTAGDRQSIALPGRAGAQVAARIGRLLSAAPTLLARPAVSLFGSTRLTRMAAATSARVGVFVDKQRTYKIDYPGDWTMVNHDQYVRGAYVDARLIAPDGNAGVVGQSLSLPPGQSFNLEDPYVQNVIAGSIQFAAFGAEATEQAAMQVFTVPSGDQVLVGRVPFQWVDPSLAPSQFPNVTAGMQGGVLFVVLHNGGRLYLVTGTIADLTAASAVSDAQQLTAIFSSLDLLHTYHPAGKPHAIVDATRTYRLAFPSTWSYSKNVPNGDTALVSQDHTSAVVALAAPAPKGVQQISPSYMNSTLTALGSTLGTVTQPPTFHKIVAKRSIRYAATLQFRRADGKTGKALLVATMHHARICAVVGIVMDQGGAGIRQQAQQASYIVSSLHLE